MSTYQIEWLSDGPSPLPAGASVHVCKSVCGPAQSFGNRLRPAPARSGSYRTGTSELDGSVQAGSSGFSCWQRSFREPTNKVGADDQIEPPIARIQHMSRIGEVLIRGNGYDHLSGEASPYWDPSAPMDLPLAGQTSCSQQTLDFQEPMQEPPSFEQAGGCGFAFDGGRLFGQPDCESLVPGGQAGH